MTCELKLPEVEDQDDVSPMGDVAGEFGRVEASHTHIARAHTPRCLSAPIFAI